jgi:hypothetical protein
MITSKEWKAARWEDGLSAYESRISYNDWFQAQYYETDHNTYGYGTHSKKTSKCPICCVRVSNQTSQYPLRRTTERIMLGTKCIQ